MYIIQRPPPPPPRPQNRDWNFLGVGVGVQEDQNLEEAEMEFPEGRGVLRKNTFHGGCMDIFWKVLHIALYDDNYYTTTISVTKLLAWALLHLVRHLPLSSIGLVPMSALLPVVFHFHEEQIC